MVAAIIIASVFILPYAVLKAIELQKIKKNKRWSDDEAEVIDNWKYPSNFY